MKPIVAPARMSELDASCGVPVPQLIRRAAAAIHAAARDMLGGVGSVVILAGPGLNGSDGRVAGEFLAADGCPVEVVAPDVDRVPPCDLLIDAAFGNGLSRPYLAPPVESGTRVLAVDVPSGISGLTGAVLGRPLMAERTVTFVAPKPGLVLGAGPTFAGELVVADIGIDPVGAECAHLVEASDVVAWLPARPYDANKYHAALLVVAGSDGMTGAASLVSRSAMRTGSGYVTLVSLAPASSATPVEVVVAGSLDEARVERHSAGVIGPGLGRSGEASRLLSVALDELEMPLVVDGDALTLLADRGRRPARDLILTPHDGEYRALTGEPPGDDRLGAARRLAAEFGAFVLLKGPSTVVASPGGEALVVANGDERLATAGSGDVLAGMVGSLLAQGLDPLRAAASAAYLHAEAANRGPARGLMASDLADRLPVVVEHLCRGESG